MRDFTHINITTTQARSQPLVMIQMPSISLVGKIGLQARESSPGRILSCGPLSKTNIISAKCCRSTNIIAAPDDGSLCAAARGVFVIYRLMSMVVASIDCPGPGPEPPDGRALLVSAVYLYTFVSRALRVELILRPDPLSVTHSWARVVASPEHSTQHKAPISILGLSDEADSCDNKLKYD